MAETLPRADLLETIVAATRRSVASREQAVPRSILEEMSRRSVARVGRSVGTFRNALVTGPTPRVIAECKRRSPSRGVLRRQYDPAAIAAAYVQAGAAAISVLTEPSFFDGGLDHLAAVRATVEIPILRKDFIVTEYQLLETCAAGADAVLLIVAACEDTGQGRHDPGLHELVTRARTFGLDVVVEVHDEAELEHALGAGADIIGVNNRNLRTLDVGLDVARRLAPRIPDGVVKVAESGMKTTADLTALAAVGYDAFLVGERFMTAPDPAAALRELLGSPQRAER